MKDFMLGKSEIMEALKCGAFHRADDGSKLYHYTSIDVLKSIINSNSVYATEYHYLNDEEEFRYIDKIVNKVLTEIFSKTKIEKDFAILIKKHLKKIRAKTDDPKKSYYVVCFSNTSDNLTLWAEFARFGCNFESNSYAINVDEGVYGSVIYDSKEQQELIIEVFRNVFEHFEIGIDICGYRTIGVKLEKLTLDQLDIVAECLAELLVYYGSLMKRKLYEAEQEFRVVLCGTGHDIKYREKDCMLIPYIEVKIDKDLWLGKKITLAPLNHKDICKRSVQTYIKSLGYKDVKVKYSEIRLRY